MKSSIIIIRFLWSFLLLTALPLLITPSLQAAGPRSLDFKNPNTSLYFLDPASSTPQCKKTTLGDPTLPEWVKEKVAPNLQPKRRLTSRMLNLSSVLGYFQKKKPKEPCEPKPSFRLSSRQDSFYEKTQDFNRVARAVLKDKAYQFLEPQELWEQYKEKIDLANEAKKDHDKKRYSKLNIFKRIGSGISSLITATASLFSETSDDYKIGKVASNVVGKGLEQVISRKVNSLNFKSLLPDNSYKLQWIKRAHGLTMMAIGSAGLALAPFSAGLSTTILGAVGSGIGIVAAAAGFDRWNYTNRDRHLIVERTNVARGFPELGEALGIGAKIALEAGHRIAHVQPIHFFPAISAQVLTYLPFIGGAVQVGLGASLFASSFVGYEEGHEVLREYEILYKDIFFNKINERKRLLENILAKARNEFVPENGSLSPEYMENVSGACEAMKWLDEVEIDGIKRFTRRIKYLDEKLEWRLARNVTKPDPQTYREKMKKFFQRRVKENEELEQTLIKLNPSTLTADLKAKPVDWEYSRSKAQFNPAAMESDYDDEDYSHLSVDKTDEKLTPLLLENDLARVEGAIYDNSIQILKTLEKRSSMLIPDPSNPADLSHSSDSPGSENKQFENMFSVEDREIGNTPVSWSADEQESGPDLNELKSLDRTPRPAHGSNPLRGA